MDIYLRGSLLKPGLLTFCRTPWSGCCAQVSTAVLCLRQGCASMCLLMKRYIRAPSARMYVSTHASVCVHSCHRWLGGVLFRPCIDTHINAHSRSVHPPTHHRPTFVCASSSTCCLLTCHTWSQNCACYYAGQGLRKHPKHISYTDCNHLTIVQCHRSHRQPAMHELQQLGISEGFLQASS